MDQLEELIRAYPMHPFALIHMGRLQPNEARRLIETHPNIYFLTSHANTIAVNKSAQPWTDMFDGERLSPAWRELVVRCPKRFILAFDNVFAEHWGDFYLDKLLSGARH